MRIKLCLFGPTGSGKTTLARYIAERYGAIVVRIAAPLYLMQDHFYATLGKQPRGQDGELLQFLADKVEREQPGWLGATFVESIRRLDTQIIVNDDCRWNAYQALEQAGFYFVKVQTSEIVRHSRLRRDHVALQATHDTELHFDKFRVDAIVVNDGPLTESYKQIDRVMCQFVRTQRRSVSPGGWLTGSQIEDEVRRGNICIEPFDRTCLNPNSYNYHLSQHIKRLTNELIDCAEADEYEDIIIPPEGLILHPRECYLGCTVEQFHSDIYASLVTGRSSIGRKFITNHVTAGLVDQGFRGQITLEITVQRKTRVYPNMEFGQIFWFTTVGEATSYQGKYQSQNGPTPSQLHQQNGKS
jgi:dCTP deaminase